MAPTFTRLPTNVVPERYEIRIQSDFSKFTFEGDLSIHVIVKKETNEIVLNYADIVVHSATLTADDTQTATISYQEEEEKVIFTFPANLKPGKAVLKLKYTGILNDKMKGYYRSKYVVNGEERYMGTTQFEAPDARRAFPCWDEPEHRAIFSITLIVPPNRIAVSNMPVTSEKQVSDDGTREVSFGDSPLMPTYLVAWVIGEFEYLEDKTPRGVVVRVYVPLGKKEQGTFALEVATKTLPYYEEYFGIDYPLPKIDLLAIPDFAAGAMENWGCVTYRETALLVDPKNSSAGTRQWVALVVGHELAHQWFGNLVTMKWWTHLWLNEGFATWIEYLTVDNLFTEWKIWTQYITLDFDRALSLDSLKNSHPIEVEVHGPGEIDEIFDVISYSKGSTIIRMLERYLGGDVFKRGLHHYLNKHQYSNAATEDLWEALSFISGKDVAQLMDTWTKQTGYPVLYVSEVSSETGRKFQIKQQRYLSSGPEESDTALWQVPLSYVTASIPTKFVVLKERNNEVHIPEAKKEEWIKFNPESQGFYRVHYSPELLSQLSKSVTTLSALDRIGLETDAFAFAQSGVSKTTDYLELLLSYQDENEYTVWNNISGNLGVLGGVIRATEFYDSHFLKYGRDLFAKIFAKVGWEPKQGEGHLTGLLRSLVLSRLGAYKDQSVVDEAVKRFQLHFEKKETIIPDLRTLVYSLAVRSEPSNYDKLLELHDQTDLHEEKVRILRSLGSASTQELLQRTLDLSISEKVRSQDGVFLVDTVAVNRNNGAELTWKWFTQNHEILFQRYKGFLLTRLVSSVTAHASTRAHVDEIKEWFKDRTQPGFERTLAQSLERVERNISWLERESAAIEHWLKNRYPQ